jgi:hypothetical protein
MPAPDEKPPELAAAPGVTLLVSPGETFAGDAGTRTVTTAADSTFAIELPAGRYCITRAGRGPRPERVTKHYDLPCLVQQWERCDAVATVPAEAPLAFEIHEACAGLSCYHGPPPP